MDFDRAFEASKPLEASLLVSQVKNLMAIPNWIGWEDRFWIKLQDESGYRFDIVDAASGAREPAFHHAAVARALSEAGAGEQNPQALGIISLAIDGDERILTLESGTYRCNSDGTSCRKLPAASAAGWRSPDGTCEAFVRDNNIWIRKVDGSNERQLTHDGTETHAYGAPDPYSFTMILQRRAGLPLDGAPQGVLWSPSGRYLVAFRIDFTEVPVRTHSCECAAPDKRYLFSILAHINVMGDNRPTQRTVTIIDVQSTDVIDAQLGSDDQLQDCAWYHAYQGAGLWWHEPTGRVFVETANWRGNRYGIAEVELKTGRSRVVIDEAEPYWYMFSAGIYRPSIRLLNDCGELIWYSQRSGYGHLYLYDVASGRLKRPVTQGNWVVYDLLHVDEEHRFAYFTAGGKEAGRNPYYRHLYRVSLDGGEPLLLTPDDADHEFEPFPSIGSIAPTGRYFVDAYSTVASPPVAVLRRSDGSEVAPLYRADAIALERLGWRPPEPLQAFAADGKTPLYGVMYKPADFDRAKKYPILELTYPAPFGKFVPTTFLGALQPMLGNPHQAAQLGMAVVAFDGRGCAGRDRDFLYAHAGTEDVCGSADHVAAIRQFAAENSWMDVTRVGLYGVSFGGYGALRAQLLNGDFFNACVSAVGPSDWREWGGGSVWSDRYFRVSDDIEKAEQYFEVISNVRLAPRLVGQLLLIYGEIDENCPLNQPCLLFQGLQQANKDYDELLMVNQGHNASLTPYGSRRTLKFLFEHLASGGF